jgi:hypothetical protein
VTTVRTLRIHDLPVLIGVVVGFALAQLMDLAKLAYWWLMKPRLEIQQVGDRGILLDHSEEIASGEVVREIIYGFFVRNCGRRMARGVEAMLVKIEIDQGDDAGFHQFSADTCRLCWHGVRSDAQLVTLVPGTTAIVSLARWRDDLFCVVPDTDRLEEYYSETCVGAARVRFSVVVVDDHGTYASREFTIENRRAKD